MMKNLLKTLWGLALILPSSGFGQAAEPGKALGFKSHVQPQINSISGSLSDFDVRHYRLELKFPLVSSAFEGKAVLTVLSNKNGLNELTLDAVGLTVDSISVPGNVSSWSWVGGGVRIQMNRAYGPGETFAVRLAYRKTSSNGGFYFYADCAYTFSEPQDARAWFPCRDVPWDKASAELFITAPAGVKVASIGLLKSRTRSADGQWETFHWLTDHPVATYLVCVSLSRNYAQWSDWYTADGDSLELMHYIFKRDSALAVQDLLHMKDAIYFFSSQFGPYPFEKYGECEVEPFNYGGMEHQTMVTFNSIWVRGDRAYENGFVHELSHMWWGDAVTLADWPDIWLNEGFATYSSALFEEYFYGQAVFHETLQRMKSDYVNQSLKNDFPPYAPPYGELFNWGIVYSKGGLVLHMLRRMTGEENFRRIMQAYFQTYRYKNASTDDFRAVCESVSGIPLGRFFEQWIYGKGFPEIVYSTLEQPLQSGGAKVILTVQQVQKNTGLFQLPLDVRLAGIMDTTVVLEKALERFVFSISRPPDSLVLDPGGWLVMNARQIPSDIRELGAPPDRSALMPAFPNPFNAEATVYYDVADADPPQRMTLAVYNLMGERVRILADAEKSVSGKYQAVWDGRDADGKTLPSGVYLIRLQAGAFNQEQKAVLVR
jgi:aminopeptidase N